MARYENTGTWEPYVEGGGLVHFHSAADGLHLVYGSHTDVIRIHRRAVHAGDETLSDLENHERIVDALRSGGVAAVRRQAERLGGVDAALPLGCRLIEIAVTFGDVESRA